MVNNTRNLFSIKSFLGNHLSQQIAGCPIKENQRHSHLSPNWHQTKSKFVYDSVLH